MASFRGFVVEDGGCAPKGRGLALPALRRLILEPLVLEVPEVSHGAVGERPQTY